MSELLDKFLDIAILLVIAAACIWIANFLVSRKIGIITTINELVQKAENAIQGSKMGAERKAWVLAQLEDKGIIVTAWVSRAIDISVAWLNKTAGWLRGQASSDVSAMTDGAAQKMVDSIEDDGDAE
jgi:hypothetical protein